jgi:hypothetical protein
VPLYLSQDRALDDGLPTAANLLATSALTLTRPSKSAEDQAAPPQVMYYPPLAYLLNAILFVLNGLRECPLLIARDECLRVLGRVCEGVCTHLVFSGDDLRSKCIKYQDQMTTDLANKQQLQQQQQQQQQQVFAFGDVQYAKCVAQDLIPHVLYCFDCVFPHPNTHHQHHHHPANQPGSNTKKSQQQQQAQAQAHAHSNNPAHVFPQGYHVDKMPSVKDRSEVLSPDGNVVLINCWQILVKGKLITTTTSSSSSLSSSSM